MRLELTISRLGAQGDGVTDTADGPVYVPFTLPGERVVADVEAGRGRLIEILQTSPQRQSPICRHFGECGGCALQHLQGDAYREWKRLRIVEALGQERIEVQVEPVAVAGAGTRRRTALSAAKQGGRLALGFRRAQSHDLIDIEECPVLAPRLSASLPALRHLLARVLPQGEARISLTAAENGLDVGIGTTGKLAPFSPQLADEAGALGIIRLTLGGDPLLSTAQPQVTLAGVRVELPPAAFLQASEAAEIAIAALAVEAVGKARSIADLFCGAGTFTFALARKATVTAVEFDRTLLTALEGAARRAGGLKPIKTLRRDLMREPLAPMELNAFDAVLFDPPRAGAMAQAKALAASRVPKVVAVSCNPATFARDARILLDGGFTLQRVVPADQFVYSPHVELIAVLERPAAPKRASRHHG